VAQTPETARVVVASMIAWFFAVAEPIKAEAYCFDPISMWKTSDVGNLRPCSSYWWGKESGTANIPNSSKSVLSLIHWPVFPELNSSKILIPINWEVVPAR
jgi:hypothetical protein